MSLQMGSQELSSPQTTESQNSLLYSEKINKALSAALKKNQRDIHAEGDSAIQTGEVQTRAELPPAEQLPDNQEDTLILDASSEMGCGDGGQREETIKSLEELLQDLYVASSEEEKEDVAVQAKTKPTTKEDEPSISFFLKLEGKEDSDVPLHRKNSSGAKPLDQLLKDLCESDMAEAKNRNRSFLNYSYNAQDREIPLRDRDKELTNKEEEQLRDFLMQMNFTQNEDSDSEDDDKKRRADPKRLLDPNVTSNLWKQILGKKAFRAGMKEVYNESEEALWPWMSKAEKARVKEIDDELERLKETHLARLKESELSRLLVECQESLEKSQDSS